MTALRQALEYRDRGLSVLPIAPRSKRPHSDVLKAVHGCSGWNRFKSGIAAEADIRAWFEREPNLNVGVITGEASGGLVAIDLDQPVEGFRFPATPTVRTSRGRHIWAKAASPLRTTKHEWGEVRAGGAYVVAPPSLHEDGTRYEWELSLDEVDLADFSQVTLPDEGRGTEAEDVLPQYPSDNAPERFMLARDEGAVIEACRVLGIDTPVGKSFRCVLPGHEEGRPSASVFRAESGAYRYFDWHRRSGADSFSLAHILLAQSCGRVVDVPPPSLARWNLRLFHEAGCLEPVSVDLPAVPSGLPPSIHRVAQGFELLVGLRWLRDPIGTPVPFAWDFASAWCGPGRRQTGEAILALRRHGIIARVEDQEWTGRGGRAGHLFLPGDGCRWRPGP